MSTQPTQSNIEPVIRALDFVKENILPFDDTKDGRRFLAEFEKFLRQHPDFQNNYPDFYQEIFEMVVKLKWLCLPNQAEKAIIDLIANNFVVIFTIPNFNLLDKFKTKLTHFLDLAQRDELKTKVKTAILKNNQILTKAGVVIDTYEHRGTIANWLLDYNKNLGGARQADTLKFREYIASGQNTADLTDQDKTKIILLFNFYESLKLSSQTPQGIEESIAFVDKQGHLKVLEDGMVEDVDTNKQVKELMKLVEPVKIADIDININHIGLPRPVEADQRVRPTDVRPTDVRPTDVRPTVGATLVVAQNDGRPNIGATTRDGATTRVAPTNTDHFTFQDAQSLDQFRQPGVAFQSHQFAIKLQQVKDLVVNNIKSGLVETWFARRLDSLILTYLKGIRDELDTRQRLADNVKIGGLGLEPEIINQIFDILKNHNQQSATIKSAPRVNPPVTPPPFNKIQTAAPLTANNQPKIKKANQAPQALSVKINSVINKLNQNKELPPPQSQDKFLPKLSAASRLKQTNSSVQIQTAPKLPAMKRIDFGQIDQSRAAIRFQPKISSKQFIQDVKAPPELRQHFQPIKVELAGPVQEIASLDLADLRKAGSVENFTDFLLHKIKEIEKISYAKKAQAVKAWQHSPLYQLYLKLGSLSMQKGLSLADLLKILDADSNLTWAEFEGISRLNGQMRN